MLFRFLKEILNQKIHRKNQQSIKKAAVESIYIIVYIIFHYYLFTLFTG